jgi:hypothetical protein
MPATTSLEDFKIKGLPSSAFYIANFISEEEEQLLLEKVRFCSHAISPFTDFSRLPQRQNQDGKNFRKDVYRRGRQI